MIMDTAERNALTWHGMAWHGMAIGLVRAGSPGGRRTFPSFTGRVFPSSSHHHDLQTPNSIVLSPTLHKHTQTTIGFPQLIFSSGQAVL